GHGRLVTVKARLVGGPALGAPPRLAVGRLSRLHHALHEDAGQIDEVGRDRARLHDLVHFDDRALRGFREARVGILAARAKVSVAQAVRPVAAEQRVIDIDCGLQHIGLAVELADLPALHEVGADAGRRIERRYAGAAGAAALDEDALWHQLDLHFSGSDLLL